jgi:hypothetical protein
VKDGGFQRGSMGVLSRHVHNGHSLCMAHRRALLLQDELVPSG